MTHTMIKKEMKSGTQKKEISQIILGCVECSTNGDSLGENKISTPSLVLLDLFYSFST